MSRKDAYTMNPNPSPVRTSILQSPLFPADLSQICTQESTINSPAHPCTYTGGGRGTVAGFFAGLYVQYQLHACHPVSSLPAPEMTFADSLFT